MQLRLAGLFLVFSLAAFAQGDRGTITGTVTDPTGAVIPNANIQLTNSETSATYQVATTSPATIRWPIFPSARTCSRWMRRV